VRIAGGEISRIRHDADDYFDKTAHFFEPAESRTSNGGTAYTYPSTPTATSPCQLAPMGKEQESEYAARLGGRQGFIISVRADSRVTRKARITVDGRTFEVLGNDRGRSYPLRQRVPVVELT
jgi:hypothetical protein